MRALKIPRIATVGETVFLREVGYGISRVAFACCEYPMEPVFLRECTKLVFDGSGRSHVWYRVPSGLGSTRLLKATLRVDRNTSPFTELLRFDDGREIPLHLFAPFQEAKILHVPLP